MDEIEIAQNKLWNSCDYAPVDEENPTYSAIELISERNDLAKAEGRI